MIEKRKLLRAYFLDSIPFTGLVIFILTIAPVLLLRENLTGTSNLYKFRAYFWQLYYFIGVPFCLGVFYAQIYRTVSTCIDMLKLRTVTEELNISYIKKESFYCTGKRHYCKICPKNYAKFQWFNIALQILRSYVVDERLYSEQELEQIKGRISSGKRYTITSFRYSRIVISISPAGDEEPEIREAFDVIRKGEPWQSTVSHTTDPQGKHSSHIPYDLDVICAHVTKSRCFRVRLNRLLRKEPDYLEKHCITCHVSEDNLRALFRLHGKNLKNILHCIIDFAAPQSITDQLLREILCMKSQSIRTDCVISLSHKRLPAAQLMQLCKTDICFECYFSLIVELYVNAQYSTETLSQAIAQFMASPFASMWRQLQKELQESTPSSPGKQIYIQSIQSTDQ